MGGANTPENKVALTAREHFIVHLLLVKMTTGKAHYQMKAAVARNMGKGKVVSSSKIYAMVRQHRKDAASYFGKGRKLTLTDKENKRKAALNMDPLIRAKVSDSTRIKSPETVEKFRAAALVRPKRPCTKCGKVCAINILGRYHDDKCRW